MYILLLIVHVIVCLFLIIVVLLQSGKAADLAGAFGGMGSQTAFGPRGSATLLSKATTISAILFMLTAYPAFVLLGAAPSLGVLIAMVCWIGLLKSFFSGALPSLMAKTFPVATRVSGMSLSYNISVPIFGGFAPFFAQSLIELTGSKLAPSYYMIATAALSLAALLVLRWRYRL